MSPNRTLPEAPRPIDQLKFRGSIGNERFQGITMNRFINALKLNGWREAHNAHIFERLVERGQRFGIFTPNDFARALRTGFTQPAGNGASRRVCCGDSVWVIFRNHEFITIRDADAK